MDNNLASWGGITTYLAKYCRRGARETKTKDPRKTKRFPKLIRSLSSKSSSESWFFVFCFSRSSFLLHLTGGDEIWMIARLFSISWEIYLVIPFEYHHFCKIEQYSKYYHFFYYTNSFTMHSIKTTVANFILIDKIKGGQYVVFEWLKYQKHLPLPVHFFLGPDF